MGHDGIIHLDRSRKRRRVVAWRQHRPRLQGRGDDVRGHGPRGLRGRAVERPRRGGRRRRMREQAALRRLRHAHGRDARPREDGRRARVLRRQPGHGHDRRRAVRGRRGLYQQHGRERVHAGRSPAEYVLRVLLLQPRAHERAAGHVGIDRARHVHGGRRDGHLG